MNGKIADGEARERLIMRMRRRMAELGITTQASAESLQQDLERAPAYRDAHGNEWDGQGAMPDWLAAARNAGVNPDFFRVSATASSPAGTQEPDPRQLDFFRWDNRAVR